MKTSENTKKTNQQLLQAIAPGKIILSGEHSVVYGADAVAVAVNEYTTVTFSPISQSKVINTIFSGISSSVTYPINALSKLKHHLDDRFEQFTKGKVSVQNILNHPNDLVMYTLMSFLHQLPSRKTLQQFAPHSGVLRSHSTIPMGAGMGSSASAIAATLALYEHIIEKPLSAHKRFEMVRFCERLQHGKGSAIDAATVTFGGGIHLHNGQPNSITIDLGNNNTTINNKWFWLNTGTPQSSTGECVQYVRKHHAYDKVLWDTFNNVTNNIINQLSDCSRDNIDNSSIGDNIKENNQLLQHIGVVPHKASELVTLIEQCNGAGKICGAGSISGEKAGIVLAYLPQGNIEELLEIANAQLPQYIKSYNTLSIDTQGARMVEQFEK